MQLVATRPSEVRIDLLPTEIRTEQNTKRAFRLAIGAAVILVVLLGGITVFMRMQISDAEQTLRVEQTRATQLRGEVGSLREYELLQASIDNSRSLLATALRGDISFTKFLDDLDTHTPGDSWLQSVNLSSSPGSTPMGEAALGTAQYQAYVTSFPGLANWLDTMDAVGGLRFVYLSNGSRQEQNGREVVSFSASAFLTEEMLSGRCQGENAQCP